MTLPPAQKAVEPLGVMAGENAPTPTEALPLLLQPLAVTLTLSVTGPVGPAVKLIELVPCPPVMLPLVATQLYVAPAVAGTLALLLALAQTLAGAVMVAEGRGLTVTTDVADVAEHPAPLVTVTEYEPPVFTTTDCVEAPLDQA